MRIILISDPAAPEVAAYKGDTFLGAANFGEVKVIRVDDLNDVWFSCVATTGSDDDGVEVTDVELLKLQIGNTLVVMPVI